jgi:processive 1,2-diacylglycerol beta-glucosyltransferase
LLKNIYIFYASRKGGHRFPTAALSEYLNLNYGNQLNVRVFNLLENDKIGDFFEKITRQGDLWLPKVWQKGYRGLENNNKIFSSFYKFFLALILTNPLLKTLRLANDKLDLILSFQPEVNAVIPFIKNQIRTRIESIIVDYSAHSLWVNDCINCYYVGNDFVANRLIKLGVLPQKIKITGIPQKLTFLNALKTSAADQRQGLGLKSNLPTITIMGGFLGKMVDYFAIIKSIIQTDFNCQVIVVFGKNVNAYKKCLPLIEQAKIIIKPCVNLPDIANVMQAADIIITKPGAVTISEALTLGKPMILLTPKAGSAQELTFAQNIVASGAGLHISDTATVGYLVQQLFENPFQLSQMAEKAKTLGNLNRTATQIIAENILKHLDVA